MDAEAPEPVTMDAVWRFSIPSSEPLGRPIIAINDVTFDYNLKHRDGTKKTKEEYLLQKVNFGLDNSSKIALLGANGQVSEDKEERYDTKPEMAINPSYQIRSFIFFAGENNASESNHGAVKACFRKCRSQQWSSHWTFHTASLRTL